MSRSIITFRLRDARRSLGFDTLERRQVMTATIGLLQADASRLGDILSVLPSDGQTFSIADAPKQIVLDLKGIPIDSWEDNTVLLYKVGSDGVTSPVFDQYSAHAAVIDRASRTATIPLESPLDAGNYRIVLAPGDFSKRISQGSWDPTQDQTLAEFQVQGRQATLDDAVDLGAVGSNVQVVPGYLDIRGGASFNLYKFTLGASQPSWRVGLQLDAGRIGSELQGALTLFDQQGRVIATGNSGAGISWDQTDPYLFAALEPGTYYVGISGVGNLGGQPGGYDPTTGQPGISTQSQSGGAYQLEMVADPLTSPTKVVDFSLQWGDSSRSPIGFTITFSGAIAPDSLLGSPLFVEDALGNRIALTPMAAGSRLNQVQYYFERLLAPGAYRLVNSQDGGLTDLVGRPPAADGLPAGTLAKWTVRASEAPPTIADEAIPVTFSRPESQDLIAYGAADIAEGRSITLRLVVPSLAGSLMNVTIANGSLRVQRVDDAGTTEINGESVEPTSTSLYNHIYVLNLRKGIYLLTLSGVDEQPVTLEWKITLTPDAFPIANAVGSAGAISLRNSDASSPAASAGPINLPTLASSNAGAFTAGALPTSFASTAGSTLVGRPSTRNDSVSLVGPTVSGGLVAMAVAGRGLAPGLISSSVVGDDGRPREPDGTVAKKGGQQEAPAAELGAEVDETRLADGEDRGVRADASALVEADRLAEAARKVSPWLFREVGNTLEAVGDGDPLRAVEIARGEAAAVVGDPEPVERAALGVPVSVVVAAAAAFRFRQVARKWWKRPPAVARPSGSGPHPFWRGPRFLSPSHRRASRSLRAAQRV
jgi:hypothetical protein